MKQTIYFSGGRTSGYMLYLLIEKYGVEGFNDRFIVIFSNTGKEMGPTLRFVQLCASKWGIPINWTEYSRVPARMVPAGVYPTKRRNTNLASAAERGEMAHWFRTVNFVTASRNGEPFTELLDWMSVLPNVRSRACSSELKIRTGFRFMFSQGYKQLESYIGIRADEAHRAIQIRVGTPKFNKPFFPLIDLKITEKDVLNFWKHNDFDLQLESYQGNCDVCFLKAKWKQVQVIRDNPASADWWLEQEAKKRRSAGEGSGAFFRVGRPISKLVELAKSGVYIPRKKDEDIPCSCAERGFDSKESYV